MNLIHFLASHCVAVLAFGCLDCSAAQPPAIVSSVPTPGISGGRGSYVPTFNADGRFVIFLSQANNLVTNDSIAPVLDLFRYDRMTGQTVLISANVTGIGGGDADSAYASVSAEGRLVSFASAAGDLVSGDTNGIRDLFVRDMEQRITHLVSATLPLDDMDTARYFSRTRSGIPRFNRPLLSGDGSKVVFESWATNLVFVSDTNNHNDIFIRDLASGITSLVSVNASDDGAGNGRSEQASMTPDARRVAFLSRATDLVPGTTNALGDIYVRDLFTQTTLWASSNVVEHLPGYLCHPPVISTDGQAVVFKASAPGAANASVFHVDLATGVTSLLHMNSPTATDVVVSGDGSTVAFDDGEQVFLWHGGVTTLVSKRADGTAPANGNSTSPVLSLDGQVVAYVSAATDIVTNGFPSTNTAHQIYVWNRQTGVTRLVTQNTNGAATLASHQFAHIALSPDGTQIAFDSLAGDLVPGDLNAASDVFITPVASNALTLISRRAESLPSLTGMRNVRIAPDCLTADKRFLLFASTDKNRTPDDAANGDELFIRDLTTGAEEQITEHDLERFGEHVISANGRAVAYIARIRDGAHPASVIHYDRETGARVLAHADPLGEGFLAGPFTHLTISPDGNKVSYLAPSRFSTLQSVYLFDSRTGSNRVLNVRFNSPANVVQDGSMSAPRFSPDGAWLAFGSESRELTTNRSPGLAFLDLNETNGLQVIPLAAFWTRNFGLSFSADSRHVGATYGMFDLQTRTYSPVPAFALSLLPRRYSLSADGRIVAWEVGSGGWNIAVTNRQSGLTKIVSMNAVPGSTGFPSITPDGRYLVFASRSTNLVATDRSFFSDIYLRDLTRDVTILLSSGDAGATPGNGSSTMPILSADGRTVLFQSFADDLAAGDYNFSRDIFMAQLGGPDSDGDGMDDDWEMAYFSTLSRNGTGDFDNDGASDLVEFLAGTDPTDLGSILRVISITSLNGGHTRLVWSASPGRTYQVQFKDNLDDPQWSNLGTPITPVSTTASAADAPENGGSHRFYRVQLIQ